MPAVIEEIYETQQQFIPIDIPAFFSQPHFAIEVVDPEKARVFLRANYHNRKFIQSSIETFSEDMEKDNWKFTGATIKIDKDGKLLDGQHRLAAIIRTQKAQDLAIMYNLEPDCFTVIDTGSTRRGKDVFSIQGELNCYMLASACRMYYLYDNALFLTKRWLKRRVTNNNLLNTLALHPGLRESVHIVTCSKVFKSLVSPSMIAFCYYLFHQINEKDADTFFTQIETGAEIQAGSAVLKLRDKFLRNKADRNYTINTIYACAITIKAWNAFRHGETVNNLTFQQGRVHPEEFPEAI